MSALWLSWEPRAIRFRVGLPGITERFAAIIAIRWSRWPILRMEEFK